MPNCYADSHSDFKACSILWVVMKSVYFFIALKGAQYHDTFHQEAAGLSHCLLFAFTHPRSTESISILFSP